MPGRIRHSTETGASLVEFALLVTLIAIVALVAVQFAGTETSSMWSEISSAVGSANSN